MSEQSLQQPADYLQQHPNAVQDPVKAEIMAYASRDAEEAVVAARGLAVNNHRQRRWHDSSLKGFMFPTVCWV